MENRNGMMLLPVLLHPQSNGTIRLKSTDPFESPIIDPNYLAVREDVDVLVDGNRTFYLSIAPVEKRIFQ